MKKIILGLALLSLNAYSANVDLQINSQVKTANSSKSTASSIVAELGKEWSLPFQGSKNLMVRMTVTKVESRSGHESSNDLMFDAKMIELKNGKENILSSPKVTTTLGKEAKITTTDSKGLFVEMVILPFKITE